MLSKVLIVYASISIGIIIVVWWVICGVVCTETVPLYTPKFTPNTID